MPITIEIPHLSTLVIEHVVLDYNGTIAIDGRLSDGVKAQIGNLAELVEIHVLTADTNGSVAGECEGLPVTLKTIPHGEGAPVKAAYVEMLGAAKCACLGNGRIDVAMLDAAGLSVAVIGVEGAYAGIIQHADICVCSIEDALGLLLKPNRIIADLRG